MSEPKIYVPGNCKGVTSPFGEILKLNMPVEDLKKLIDEHADNGWITFAIGKRREVGPKGQTHSVWVDKWKPDAGKRTRTEPQPARTEETEEKPPF